MTDCSAGWRLAPLWKRHAPSSPACTRDAERTSRHVLPGGSNPIGEDAQEQIASPARTLLLVLMAAAAVVFVIACSNVANLILARSVRREGELAVRAALGAGRGALRRTLLAESLVLCAAGAGLGLLLAQPLVRGGPLCRALFHSRARSHGGRGVLGLGPDWLSWPCCSPTFLGCHHPIGPAVWGWLAAACGSRRHEPPSADLCHDSDRMHVRTLAGAGMLVATLTALQTANTGYDLRQVLAIDLPGILAPGLTDKSRASARKSLDGLASCRAWKVSRRGERALGACPGATAGTHNCNLSPRATSPRTAKTPRRVGCESFPSVFRSARRSDRRWPGVHRQRPHARKLWPSSTRAWRSGYSPTVMLNRRLTPTNLGTNLGSFGTGRIVGIVADVDEDNVVQEPSMIALPASQRRRPSVRACRRRSARAHPVGDAHHPRGLRRSGGRATRHARGDSHRSPGAGAIERVRVLGAWRHRPAHRDRRRRWRPGVLGERAHA